MYRRIAETTLRKKFDESYGVNVSKAFNVLEAMGLRGDGKRYFRLRVDCNQRAIAVLHDCIAVIDECDDERAEEPAAERDRE